MLAKPITVVVFAYIIFGESLPMWELVGGSFVLIGLFMIDRNRLKLTRETSDKPADLIPNNDQP